MPLTVRPVPPTRTKAHWIEFLLLRIQNKEMLHAHKTYSLGRLKIRNTVNCLKLYLNYVLLDFFFQKNVRQKAAFYILLQTL